MKIQIRTFGPLTDHLTDTELEYSGEPTIAALRRFLLEQYPAIKPVYFRMALGSRMAEDAEEIMDGDEVSLMPPFSGG